MRVAILGMGSIGKRHAANLTALSHDLIVYDIDLQACGSALGEPSRWITALSLKSVWESQPEAVLICTPPDSHLDLAREALKRRIHCFIEKPLGTSAPELWRELGEQAEADELVTMVACNWRFAAGPRQIRQWLSAGVLGEVLSARLYCGYSIDDKRGYKRSYVAKTGAVLDIGAHLVDLALEWFGPGRLLSAVVRSATSIGLPRMDGVAEMLIAHDSGLASSIHVNLLQRHYRHAVAITGREGTIGYDFANESIYSQLWGEPWVHNGWSDQPDMFMAELAYFLDCVDRARQTGNPISQAVKVLEILLKAKEMACPK